MHWFCFVKNKLTSAVIPSVPMFCDVYKTGAQPGLGAFGAFATPKFSKHCIAILTFEETFK